MTLLHKKMARTLILKCGSLISSFFAISLNLRKPQSFCSRATKNHPRNTKKLMMTFAWSEVQLYPFPSFLVLNSYSPFCEADKKLLGVTRFISQSESLTKGFSFVFFFGGGRGSWIYCCYYSIMSYIMELTSQSWKKIFWKDN